MASTTTGNGHANGHSNGHANGLANGKPREPAVDIAVALSPNDLEKVPGLIQDISAAGKALNPDDSAARLQLLERARDLVRALETPRETMIKHLWAQVSWHSKTDHASRATYSHADVSVVPCTM